MHTRPTLADRLMFIAARAHAQRVFHRFLAATRKATQVQRRVLLDKIRRNAESDFGRDHRFDLIRTPEDFSRRIPVLTYEDHRPYIERVKAGDTHAMFGGRQRVLMFALTSGTTDEPKFIPVTGHFLAEYKSGWNAFGIKALLDHPAGFLRRIVQISSRMDEFTTPAGIPCGAITGLMAATQKLLVRKYYISPPRLTAIEDASAKHYTIMRLAVPSDVGFSITASPATHLKLARTADKHREQLIRDVHDGTLWSELAIPGDVREWLAPRLRPDPASARRLDAIVSRHGRLLPRHYWTPAFIANWTGGTMGLYLQDFPEYFGDVPVRDIGLLASEGRMSIPVEDGTPAGVLDVTSHYYEFVPVDRIEESSPEAVPAHGVEVGREYYILLTTSSGLYRYNIGDVVRVVGFEGQAPVIEFLNKGAHTSSLAGEKLTEHQVILAMNAARQTAGAEVSSFVLAPKWDDPPCYVLHVELAANGPQKASGNLACLLDAELQRLNLEYAGKRRSDRLGPLRLNVLPAGYLAARDHHQAESRRKGNEQFKHRYLYCRPGEDADFPLQPAGADRRASAVPTSPEGSRK